MYVSPQRNQMKHFKYEPPQADSSKNYFPLNHELFSFHILNVLLWSNESDRSHYQRNRYVFISNDLTRYSMFLINY